MRVEYEQESYLLPENLKKRRQEELQQKELEVRTLQQQRFGEGGDLDRKRAELLRPIQDRVYSTIERVAHEKNYAFVFDKSGSNTLLFVSKKYDISDEVLELLGYKPSNAPAPEVQKDEAATKASKTSPKRLVSMATPYNSTSLVLLTLSQAPSATISGSPSDAARLPSTCSSTTSA